ncbi:MAG: Uma2 family endonuclease [Pirellulales bacterium]
MKAVMPEVPGHILEWRKRTGADRWDEMWEGVLHMPPMPNRSHQDLEGALETWLRTHWAGPRGNRVYHQINVASVGGWPNSYRIPDLVLLTPKRFDIDRNEYFEGAPEVVVEIRSPGDETIEKLPFYSRLGVPEVWVIARDTKVPDVYVLAAGDYEQRSASKDGWVASRATGIELRGEPGGKLAIRIAGEPSTERLLPDE